MGKERLAKPGYYIEYYGTKDDNPMEFGVTHISKDQKCKYIHWMWGEEWGTLLWSCAPTKKQVSDQEKFKDSDERERLIYYSTHEEMIKNFKNINKKPGALDKSPLDI